MQLLNTLYVTLADSRLRLDNDTLRVETGFGEERETRLRVPLHHLQAVVCFGHVGMSAPLMHRLADDGIALVLLDANGRFKARLEGAVTGNVLLRQAQHRAVDNPGFTLELARAVVAGKLKNQRRCCSAARVKASSPTMKPSSPAPSKTLPPACARCLRPPHWTPCAASKGKPRAPTSRR